MKVFDYIEVAGIDLFEMDKMVKKEASVYEDKRYYILVEKYCFHRLIHDRELHDYCTCYFDCGRHVNLYTKVFDSDLLRL